MEYKARRDTLKQYTEMISAQAIFEENYGLKEFCKNVIDDLDNRCSTYCYKVRLEQTAKYAKENGYDTFTTTLLISPYQKHDELIKIGQEVAEKYGIDLDLDNDKLRRASWVYICKSIVGVFFLRRIGIYAIIRKSRNKKGASKDENKK